MKKLLVAFALLTFCGINSATAQTESIVKEGVVLEVKSVGEWSDATGHFDLWDGSTMVEQNNGGSTVANLVIIRVNGTGELISALVTEAISAGTPVRSIQDSSKGFSSIIR